METDPLAGLEDGDLFDENGNIDVNSETFALIAAIATAPTISRILGDDLVTNEVLTLVTE